MPEPFIVDLVSTRELLDRVQEVCLEQVEFSERAPAEAPAGWLDSPLSPSEIKVAFELVTALAGTITGLAALATALLTRQRDQPATTIIVLAPQTGRELARLSPELDEATVLQTLRDAAGSTD